MNKEYNNFLKLINENNISGFLKIQGKIQKGFLPQSVISHALLICIKKNHKLIFNRLIKSKVNIGTINRVLLESIHLEKPYYYFKALKVVKNPISSLYLENIITASSQTPKMFCCVLKTLPIPSTSYDLVYQSLSKRGYEKPLDTFLNKLKKSHPSVQTLDLLEIIDYVVFNKNDKAMNKIIDFLGPQNDIFKEIHESLSINIANNLNENADVLIKNKNFLEESIASYSKSIFKSKIGVLKKEKREKIM